MSYSFKDWSPETQKNAVKWFAITVMFLLALIFLSIKTGRITKVDGRDWKFETEQTTKSDKEELEFYEGYYKSQVNTLDSLLKDKTKLNGALRDSIEFLHFKRSQDLRKAQDLSERLRNFINLQPVEQELLLDEINLFLSSKSNPASKVDYGLVASYLINSQIIDQQKEQINSMDSTNSALQEKVDRLLSTNIGLIDSLRNLQNSLDSVKSIYGLASIENQNLQNSLDKITKERNKLSNELDSVIPFKINDFKFSTNKPKTNKKGSYNLGAATELICTFILTNNKPGDKTANVMVRVKYIFPEKNRSGLREFTEDKVVQIGVKKEISLSLKDFNNVAGVYRVEIYHDNTSKDIPIMTGEIKMQ